MAGVVQLVLMLPVAMKMMVMVVIGGAITTTLCTCLCKFLIQIQLSFKSIEDRDRNRIFPSNDCIFCKSSCNHNSICVANAVAMHSRWCRFKLLLCILNYLG